MCISILDEGCSDKGFQHLDYINMNWICWKYFVEENMLQVGLGMDIVYEQMKEKGTNILIEPVISRGTKNKLEVS